MMTMKSALITGAASGIGKACAERMAQEGYGVVVADVNLPAAEELAAKLAAEGLSAIAVHMDVADEQEVEAGFDKMMETYGPAIWSCPMPVCRSSTPLRSIPSRTGGR